jgi:hypothetical protein
MNIDEAKKRILTSKQYSESDFCKNHNNSYVFTLKEKGKEIFFFGTSHITDPNDPLFIKVKESFDSFNPDMVYIEGIAKRGFEYYLEKTISPLSFEEAKMRGEPAYVAKLTSKLMEGKEVGLESPEPPETEEVIRLESRGFSRREIFQYYFRRMVAQYQRTYGKNKNLEDKDEFVNYISKRRAYMKPESLGWTQDEINKLFYEELSILELTNVEKYRSEVDPIPWEGKPYGRVSEVSDASGRIRDEYIVERIAEGLKNYNKIFIVYGYSHAVVLEPALEYLIKSI